MGTKELGSLSQNLIKRLMGSCLFCHNYSLKPLIKVHNLFLCILNSIFIKFLLFAYCWKTPKISLLLVFFFSSQFKVVLVKL